MGVSKQARSLVGAVLVAFWLSACGGGGGGGGSSGNGGQTPTPTPTPTPSSGWNASTLIGTLRDALSYTIYTPSVALTSNGVGFVVWNEVVGSCGRIWANRYAGSAWGSVLEIGTAQALAPSIAANAGGDAVAVWTQRLWSGANCSGAITGNEVWGSRYTAASGVWSAPFRISVAAPPNSTIYAFSPVVALDSAGHATAVWLQDGLSSVRSVWQSRFDGAVWSTPALLSNGTRACYEPVLGQDGSGNVFALWPQDTNLYDPNQSGGGPLLPNIWAARFDAAAAAWDAPRLIGSANLSPYDSVERPHIAANAGGQAMAVWEELRGTKMSIVAARYVSGAWSTPIAIDASSQNASWPAVAIDVNGNAQAVWSQKAGATDANDSGYTARFAAANASWGTPALFEQNTEAVTGASQVGIDDSGRASIAWVQTVSGMLPIHAVHYSPGSGFDTPVHFSGSGVALAASAGGTALLATNVMSAQGASIDTSIWAAIFLP
jgi:hypothetical protein